MDWQQRIQETNIRLRNSPNGSRCSLYIKNNRLWLRGTLPSKPWLTDKGNYQQFLSLGERAKLSEDGLNHVLKQLRLIEAQLENNSFDWEDWVKSPSKITKDSLSIIDIWEKYLNFKSTSYASNTTENLKQISNYLRSLPKDIKPGVLRDRLFLDKSLPQARKYLANLSYAFEWADDLGIISENYFKEFIEKFPKSKKNNSEINPFTLEERDNIINAFANNYKASRYLFLVQMLFYTGARPSELLALKWQSIKDDFIIFDAVLNRDQSIKNSLKTQSFRKFPINSQLKRIIEENRITNQDVSQLIFRSRRGTPIVWRQFNQLVWKDVILEDLVSCQKVSSYRSGYNCRHTFITLCLNAGIDAKDVAGWVGNSAKIIYQHYAGFNKNQKVPEL
jgi:integrase